VKLERSSTAQTVQLTARVSGANPGTGGDFGGIRVRWNGGSWVTPDTVHSVTLAANTVMNVTLDVIQTATTTRTCTKPNGTTQVVTVPDHVYGAHTIQVTGTGSTATLRRSAYATIGMKNNSGGFNSGDYFLSFTGNASTKIFPGDTVDVPLQFIDANSPDPNNEVELRCTSVGGPLICSSSSATISQSWGQIVDVDGYPMLRLSPSAEGEYVVDVQWNSPHVHSSRVHVTVTSPSNPSVNEWVVVLCYARLKITAISANGVKARAISGCIPPNQMTQGFSARLLPW
jgi:hypothetical protein